MPSCDLGPRVLVSVQLQTDFSPRNEFVSVRTTIGGVVEVEPVGDIESFLDPVPMAEIRAATGTIRIRMELLDRGERPIAERLLIAEIRTDSALVVFISASCRDVRCTGPDQTCVRGLCTSALSICDGHPCRPEDCPDGICGQVCAESFECETGDSCSDPECREKVCVGVPREGACPPGFYCAVGIGCISVPPDVNPDGGLRDGEVPADGSTDGGMEVDYCATCTTSCGSLGLAVCERGVPTGECVPPAERCGGADEDCDMRIDEPPLDCGHRHAIVCQLGMRRLPDMTFERNIVSNVVGGGPGLVCGGGVCQGFWNQCQTLPGGTDGHRHDVAIGGSASLAIPDDTPFASIPIIAMASGHTHGGHCGIGAGSAEISGGVYYHRIADDGGDPARFDQFCVPPVGSPDSACRSGFGFCETD